MDIFWIFHRIYAGCISRDSMPEDKLPGGRQSRIKAISRQSLDTSDFLFNEVAYLVDPSD